MAPSAFETLRNRAAGGVVALSLLARALRTPPAPTRDLRERLAALQPRLPVAAAVTIHWDEHQIPFIEAAQDDDLPVALGAVHAHLRLTQMDLLRRISQGRLAELVGPLAIEIDRALRLFGFAHATPAIIAGLAPVTRRWAEGFVRGLNHVIATAAPPPECALLGFACAPWTLADLITASRLAGADVTWIVWSRLLRTRAAMSQEAWRALWPLLLSGAAPPPEPGLGDAAAAFARTGSNEAAVAGWRSRSGGALLAADPHLSVALPNIWLACGFHSPGYNATGLMPAGFPIVAIGRNRWLGWAGTSLHAASSDLLDVSGHALHERREIIGVRGGPDRELVLRWSTLGPVVSDGMILRHPRPLALRWTGHAPSDEIGAMLAVLGAREPGSVRTALAPFAIPGQNMIYATADGHVGHLLATRVPRRPATPPADMIADADAATGWDDPVGTPELPHWPDPITGFVASANNRPPPLPVPVGFFFSPDDRVRRIATLLGGRERLGLADLAALQQDVTVPSVLALRDALAARLPAVPAALASWDGGYDAASAGALLFEVVLATLARRLGRNGGLPKVDAVWTSRALMAEAILATPDAKFRPAAQAALRDAARALRRWRNWGGLHRMRLDHHLAAVPLLGRRFRYTDTASPGGNDTLNKTGHGPARGRHRVSYGASARFLADMADPDANRVVLLGGQDGWLGSTTFLDQAETWRDGRTIALPLQPEAARLWPHHTHHSPGDA